jgi:outer membrane protein assembly factor BamA
MLKKKYWFLSFVFLSCCNFQGFSQEQRITAVAIIGANKTKESFLKKVISVTKNQALDSIAIASDIRFLIRLPSVSNASYKVTPNENGYNVAYTIEENFTIIPYFNIYTSNNSEVAYRIGISEYNFLGRNMVVGGFYQKDIYDSYRISIKAPYLFSKKFGLGLSYQNFTSLEPVFFTQGTVDFKYNNTSYEFLAMYELNGKNRFSTGVNFFTEDYKYQPKEGDVAPPISNLIEEKVLYKLIYQYDDLNYNYHYVSGFKNIFNFQYVTSETNVSSPNFLIGWNDFLFYKRHKTRGNFACRLRLGLATNNNSPFAPFSLDNNVNIRGVGNVIDRGTGSIVLNTEYRYSILDKPAFCIQGNAFIDTGSWRNPGGNLDDFVSHKNIVVFSGLGLRFIHKRIANAVFRIDYGIGVTEKTHGLVFGIGQYF